MYDTLYYSIGLFAIVLFSGCILNLLRHHFVFQLTGIAFFFTITIFRFFNFFQKNPYATLKELYEISLPMLMGISACLISMVLGFWIFPTIRKKFRA